MVITYNKEYDYWTIAKGGCSVSGLGTDDLLTWIKSFEGLVDSIPL